MNGDERQLLKVSSLSKYYGSRVGCLDVSLELWPGEVLAVVGESGSGKTTLLDCISTRLTPTSGTALIDGRDVVEEPLQVRRRIGFLSGNTGLPWLLDRPDEVAARQAFLQGRVDLGADCARTTRQCQCKRNSGRLPGAGRRYITGNKTSSTCVESS